MFAPADTNAYLQRVVWNLQTTQNEVKQSLRTGVLEMLLCFCFVGSQPPISLMYDNNV